MVVGVVTFAIPSFTVAMALGLRFCGFKTRVYYLLTASTTVAGKMSDDLHSDTVTLIIHVCTFVVIALTFVVSREGFIFVQLWLLIGVII